MTGFENFVNKLQITAPEPVAYGWFHLMFIGIVIVLTTFLCIFFKNTSWKKLRIILITAFIAMFLLEICKQLVFSLKVENGIAEWNYKWYAFPFQFCSSPLYILPIAILARHDNIKDASISFLSFFALFGGLVVMLVPNDVFSTSFLLVQIQTMVHHGLMVVLGIFLMVYNRSKLNFKYYLKGLIIFVILCAVAFILNETIVLVTTDTFNMFYFSRHFNCTLLLLCDIYPKVSYPIFLAIYIVGFAVIGLIFYSIAKFCKFIAGFAGTKK